MKKFKKNLYDEIEKVINWYLGLPVDYEDYSTLMKARDKLQVLCYCLAKDTGVAFESFTKANTVRKIAFHREKRKAENGGENSTKATTIAEEFCIDLRNDEAMHEGAYKRLNILLQDVRGNVMAMNQRIKITYEDRNRLAQTSPKSQNLAKELEER